MNKDRILIIESEPVISQAISELLTKNGYECETVSSLQEATEKLKVFEAILSLIDIDVKDSAIDKFIINAQTIRPQSQFIVISPLSSIDSAINLFNKGICDYVIKPIKNEEILFKIKQCFNNLEQEKELNKSTDLLKSVDERLKKIIDTTKILSFYSDIEDLGPVLLGDFANNMDAEGGSLYVKEENGLRLLHSLDPGHAPEFIPFPLRKGSPFEKAMTNFEPIYAREIEEEKFRGSNWDGYKNGSFLIYPFSDQNGDFLGILSLHGKNLPIFTIHDLEIGSILASYSCETLRISSINKSLIRNESKFRSLFEQSNDAIFVYDSSEIIFDVNQRACEMLALKKEDIIGKKLDSFVYQEDLTQFNEMLSGEFEHGSIMFETRFKRSDGKNVYIEISSRVVDEKEVIFNAIARDITARIIHEEERKRLEAHLIQGQKLESIGILAGGIAHDFNNLLMGIIGNISLILHLLPDNSPIKQKLQNVEINAEKATELTKQLLSYSGKGQFLTHPINLTHLTEEMSDILALAVSRKTTLKYHFSCDIPDFNADASQIKQMVKNIAINASEALCDDEGEVNIITGFRNCSKSFIESSYIDNDNPEGDYVYIEVNDTGCGMDKETLLRMFDPFFSTKFTGRGLGLAAVIGIVKSHNGFIRVESALKKGTKFQVYFPVVGENKAKINKFPEFKKETGTVLIVDDEEIVLDVATDILEHIGYEVLNAKNGPEGIKVFEENKDKIELVLLDVTLPNMSGEEVFYELKKIKDDVCVVISSGYNESDIKNRIGDMQIDGFIKKPYLAGELITKVKDTISSRK